MMAKVEHSVNTLLCSEPALAAGVGLGDVVLRSYTDVGRAGTRGLAVQNRGAIQPLYAVAVKKLQ